jgi:hypothetical protein
MAARFHIPPRPTRRRTGEPTLTLVPSRLAPVLPMPRPAARPVRLVLLSCPSCDLAADPMPAPAAEQLAGTHDDLHHAGRPTAVLRTDPDPGPVRTVHAGRPVGGPDLDGAA